MRQYGVELWPGYESAVRLYEDGLLLCIENRFKVLRQQTVYDQVSRILIFYTKIKMIKIFPADIGEGSSA